MPGSNTRVLATLYNLQVNDKTLVAIHPSTAPVVDVDLNKRQILLSQTDAYKEFLSVERDHLAETVYFRVPRYFDDVDLFHTTAVVEYINAAGESRVAPIFFKDINSEPDYLILGWLIQGVATQTAGTIEFALRFYAIDKDPDDPNEFIYVYNLRTQPVRSKILYGLDQLHLTEGEEREYVNNDYETLLEYYRQVYDNINNADANQRWWNVT